MSELKTPEILWSASRQYRHNNSDEFVCGFDRDETIKIVTTLAARVSELQANVEILRDVEQELTDNLIHQKFSYIAEKETLKQRVSELEKFREIVLQGWESEIQEWIDDGEPEDGEDRKLAQKFMPITPPRENNV